jgi:hypothetical protein
VLVVLRITVPVEAAEAALEMQADSVPVEALAVMVVEPVVMVIRVVLGVEPVLKAPMVKVLQV